MNLFSGMLGAPARSAKIPTMRKIPRKEPVYFVHPLYRSFDTAARADEFAAGHVWITTLERCRSTEDKVRGDPGEGTMHYQSGHAEGAGDDSDIQLIAKRSGMQVDPKTVRRIEFKSNQFDTKIRNVFVLCTSLEKIAKFGPFCVRINNGQEFFEALTEPFLHMSPPFQLDEVRKGFIGKVDYRDRNYQDLETSPGNSAFIKPKDPFGNEKEVRMVWWPSADSGTQPLMFDCPQLAAYCERIS
jgi:hypothetical protein